MKCVFAGDVFITPDMMRTAAERYGDLVTEESYFFFGRNNRKTMRDVVKVIERGGREELDLPPDLMAAMSDAELLMVHLCPVTKALLAKAPKLKYVLCNRGGCENVDVAAASAQGVKVLLNPAHNANAVAELTIGVIFSEIRNITRSHLALKNGDWREKFPNSGHIIELKDLTVGIIGFGNVGELVCEKLSGFGCRMLVNTPHPGKTDNPHIAWDRLSFVSLEELITKSDVVSLHARAPKGEMLLGSRAFELMKPTAYFVNTARSYMVDYNALYTALVEGQIAGAAIDVFEIEPLGPSYPFLRLDNITLTNHRGSDTLNAYADSPAMMLESLRKWMTRGVLPKFWINSSAF